MVCKELLLVLGRISWEDAFGMAEVDALQGGGKRNPLALGVLGTRPPPSLVLLGLWKGM